MKKHDVLWVGLQVVHHLGEVRDVQRKPLVRDDSFLVLGPVALHPAVEREEGDLFPRTASKNRWFTLFICNAYSYELVNASIILALVGRTTVP